MDRRTLLFLFFFGLLIAVLAVLVQRAPGYMDADYYYAGALRIVSGQAGSEPYLWNYLNAPASLPAPSFSYWMPLSSVIAALGLALRGTTEYWAARILFVLAAACVPPLTAALGYRLTGSQRMALLSGLLALFPGFYLPFLTVTDAFPLFMLLGGLMLLNAGKIVRSAGMPSSRLVLFGITAGLLHMARADGLLWLAGALLAALSWSFTRRAESLQAPNTEITSSGRSFRAWFPSAAVALSLVALGYALVSAPWYLRNLREWGTLMPPGSSRAMWITRYEETMLYPSQMLTPARWLAAGWWEHIQARFLALGANFQTALAVQGGIVLFPFILLGLWKLRHCVEVRLGVFMWFTVAAVMTVIFPFAGVNGGFFHSGAGVQLLLWAAAPTGLDQAVRWYAEKRRFPPDKLLIFLPGLVLVSGALLTGFIFYQKVIGDDPAHPRLSTSGEHYRAVEAVLRERGALEDEPVLVNNPPGYWLATGRPAAVIPYGDETVLLAAAQRYHAGYVVLEVNNPHQLSGLYHATENLSGLQYITSVGETKLYRVPGPASSR